MLWIVAFIPKPSPDCRSASTSSEAAAPGQGSQGYIKKTSTREEKVCREDLDGEAHPKQGSPVGIQDGNCRLPDWQELKLSSLEGSPAPKPRSLRQPPLPKPSSPDSWLWAVCVCMHLCGTCVHSSISLGARSQVLLSRGA